MTLKNIIKPTNPGNSNGKEKIGATFRKKKGIKNIAGLFYRNLN